MHRGELGAYLRQREAHSVSAPYRAYQGPEGMWGVHGDGGGILYEPEFCRETAEAIADMENSERPPKDWEETKDRLVRAGLPF